MTESADKRASGTEMTQIALPSIYSSYDEAEHLCGILHQSFHEFRSDFACFLEITYSFMKLVLILRGIRYEIELLRCG